MKRHNQILAGLLVIQIVVSVLLLRPHSPAATAQKEPLFPGLKAEEIITLTVSDDAGNTTTLQKTDTDTWVLADADDYPAMPERVNPVLDKLVALTTGRIVARTPAGHRRLQVSDDNFVRRIRFKTQDGKQYTLYLGSSPSYGATHLRLEGQDETYLTEDLSTWDIGGGASSWIDTTYLEIPFDQVVKMTLENKNGTFVFTKDEEGNWTLEGLRPDETLKESAVTTMLRRATKISLDAPLGKTEKPEYGLDNPNAVVTLETDDNRTIVLRVGARDPDDETYVVSSSESPYYVRVSEFAVRHMVEDGRDDFVPPPVTPTPTE